MKILAIADEESKYLWDYFEKSKLEGIDLIISCGDLDPRYLSFLATFTSAPVLYVHGNHDDKWYSLELTGSIEAGGYYLVRCGGSMRYKPGEHQYTEWEMRRRVFKLFPKLVWRRGFDILVTHAPAYQLNDARDLPHQGFKIFLQLIEKYHPKFFLHGHVHMSYGRQHKRYDKYMDTYVINAFDRCVFEFETEDPEKDGQ